MFLPLFPGLRALSLSFDYTWVDSGPNSHRWKYWVGVFESLCYIFKIMTMTPYICIVSVTCFREGVM